MTTSSWFAPGLPFECTGCGDCCTGGPGAVWLDDADLRRLALHLSLNPADFEDQHVRRLPGGRSLLERFNGDCEFFDSEGRKCTVYDARPTQCRTYPFWGRNVASPEDWEGVRAECEGARVEAPLVPVERILERVAEHRRTKG